MSDFIMVLVTAANAEEAENLAVKLVSAGISPCINIVPRCRSIYLWKGEFRKDDEALMLIKSSSGQFEELKQMIERDHSYDVPEIIGLGIDRMSDKYGAYLCDFFE